MDAMLLFGLAYSVALILAGMSPVRLVRYAGPVIALFVAFWVGYSPWLFCLAALGYIALTGWMVECPATKALTVFRYVLWLLLSVVLAMHQMPGYEGWVLVDDSVLKPGSTPATLYLNYDKVLVAWSLLNFLPLKGISLHPRSLSPAWWVPVTLMGGLVVVTGLAAAAGLIVWRPGLFGGIWLFAVANLLNTCIAEELVFRGVIHRQLTGRIGMLAALLVSSLFFGAAHIAGGVLYMLVATGAGLLYGLAYIWTGRLIWAVLVHWLLNLLHMFLFTYPMAV